jgi:hypothetical protein
MGRQAVTATPTHRNFRLHFRVMANIKLPVVEQVAEKMTEGSGHSLGNLNKIEAFLETRAFSGYCFYLGTHIILL